MDSQDSPQPGLGGSHHLPPYSIFCAWSCNQHPNVILSQDSQVGILKFPKLGLPQLWGPITLCADLRLRWGLKQSYSPCWELFNSMLHVTYTQGNWVDPQFLVVGSQTANLTFSPFFGHNLCFKYSNGSCEPILDIYVPRDFWWHKKLFDPMNFNPCKCFLKIRKSIWTPTPKVGAHLKVWEFIPSHSPTLLGTWNVISKLHTWPAPSQALALVTSPRLGLRHLLLENGRYVTKTIK